MSATEFCTVTASTKRNADLGSGRTGAPTTQLAELLVTPLWPVSRSTIEMFDLARPAEMKECLHVPAAGAALPDVRENDILVVAGVEYPISHVAEWTDGDVPSLVIICQQIKGT